MESKKFRGELTGFSTGDLIKELKKRKLTNVHFKAISELVDGESTLGVSRPLTSAIKGYVGVSRWGSGVSKSQFGQLDTQEQMRLEKSLQGPKAEKRKQSYLDQAASIRKKLESLSLNPQHRARLDRELAILLFRIEHGAKIRINDEKINVLPEELAPKRRYRR